MSQRIWIVLTALFGLEGILAGQAAVEYGLGAGRAATSTAPAKGLGTAIGGVMGNLDKALKAGQEASTTTNASPAASRVVGPSSSPAVDGRKAAAASSAAASPEAAQITLPTYEDPTTIQAGIARDELARRYGPPAFEVTGDSTRRLLAYPSKRGVVQLELQDDKVIRVTGPKPSPSAIVLPR